MRSIFPLAFLAAIDLYSFQALRVVAQPWPGLARNLLYGLFGSMTLFCIFYAIAHASGMAQNWSKNMETYARATVFICYIAKMLIVPFVAIDDLRRLFSWGYHYARGIETPFDASRSRFLSQLGLLAGAAPLGLLSYGIIRNAYRYRVLRQPIGIKGLPAALQGLKIVQISDIHSGSFTFKEPVKNAINLINAQKPDLVFFTGDLVNSVADEMDNFMDVFDKIEARYGVYSVLGNHDYGDYHRWESPEAKKANLAKLQGIHQQLGWDLLMNEHRLLDILGEKVAVIGVENYSAKPQFPRYGKLAEAAAGTDAAQVRLLLSHDPSHWESQILPDHPNIHITFSGHTHGFQFGIEIPGWIKWSPVQYVYQQWAGLYQQGEQFLYVNRGLGFLGYPGRVGILPEITLIELNAA